MIDKLILAYFIIIVILIYSSLGWLLVGLVFSLPMMGTALITLGIGIVMFIAAFWFMMHSAREVK